MKVCVLASGSSGNSTYIETENKKILIDLGITLKYINECLNKLNTSFDEIDCLFISHVHDDHIKTLKTLSNKYNIKIYVSEKTKKYLMNITKDLNYLVYEDDVVIDNVTISKIATSHDSIDPRGFIITEYNKSVVYLTDTGYLNIKSFNKIKDKDVYIMESNHDLLMLREGKYPPWLKTRVLSDKGHLSNETSSIYLSKLIGKNTKKVFLAHLSKENNTPEKALKTFNDKMLENDILFNNVSCAKDDEMSEVIEL